MLQKHRKKYEEAVSVLEVNKDCEKEIMKILHAACSSDSERSNLCISMTNIDTFEKLKVKHLSAFYRCRVQEDLMEKIKLPNKGTALKVRNNELDRGTCGPYLIKLCSDVRSLPVVARAPVIAVPEPHLPTIAPPSILNLLSEPQVSQAEDVTVQWMASLERVLSNLDAHDYSRYMEMINNKKESFMQYVKLL